MSAASPDAALSRLGPIGVVAHYNLLERLEPSGPGDLFRARDTRLGRTVALRWLPADFTPTPDDRRLFVAEAQATTSLSHPNVITLFDAGEHDGRVFLAFEFLNGQSLRREMVGEQWNVRRAVETAIQIADAVSAAHAAGFAHGGLSPDSISMTSRGHAKVPAFQLAAHAGFASPEGGLHDYEAPEEADGRAPDDRSDVFSVGAILYEMLAARRPNPRGSSAPSSCNARVPRSLDELVLRAVAPNPARRQESMSALAAGLRSVVGELDGLESAVEGPPATGVPTGGIGLGVVAVVLGVVVLAGLTWLWLGP